MTFTMAFLRTLRPQPRNRSTRCWHTICLGVSLGFAQLSPAGEPIFGDTPAIPALAQFVSAGHHLLAYEAADLNNDGFTDYVFVIEKRTPGENRHAEIENQRALHIALADASGKLRLVRSNANVIYCSGCGGIYGDPFEELRAKKGSFRISHFGGSSDQWRRIYTFNYSRIDQTWQLVEVVDEAYLRPAIDTPKIKRYKPPKDFGKIDITDFDPERFYEQLQKRSRPAKR